MRGSSEYGTAPHFSLASVVQNYLHLLYTAAMVGDEI